MNTIQCFQVYDYGSMPFVALRLVRQWEEAGEIHNLTRWRERIIEESRLFPEKPISMMTARRLTEALIERGFVTTRKINGKSYSPHLTEKGWRRSELVRGKWRQFLFLGVLSCS